jgi:putative transposase
VALAAFDASHWGQKYPAIAQSWRRNWERVIPFFAFPEAVRRIIYTTDEIDKHFLVSRAIFSWRGRPRGEEWRFGWKRRPAA